MSDLARTLAEHGAAATRIAPARDLSPWSDTDLIDQMLADIASGCAIKDIAGKNGYPARHAIYRRMHSDPDFAARIAEARAAQQEHEMDECISMTDAATAEDWQVVKLRVWARQWRASKLNPAKWGDKVDVTSGGRQLQPSVVVFEAVFPAREGDGE